MANEPRREVLAQSLLPAVCDPAVASLLLSTASAVELPSGTELRFGAQVPVAVFDELSKVPARWATQLVSSIDLSAPGGVDRAAAAASDSRASVRRALVSLPGLPVDVLDVALRAAAETSDADTAALVLESQPATPDAWVRWLSDPDITVDHDGSAAASRVAASIAARPDLVPAFIASGCPAWVSAVLVECVDRPECHFADFAEVAARRGERIVQAALDTLVSDPTRCDVRMIEWLSANRGSLEKYNFSLQDTDALTGLDDRERIAAWYNSRVDGVLVALLGRWELPTPTIAETVAELYREFPNLMTDEHAMYTVANQMVQMSGSSRVLSPWQLGRATAVARTAFSMLSDVAVDETRSVFIAVHQLCANAHAAGHGDHVVDLECELAEFAPKRAGILLLDHATAPAGVGALMAADPARFGITGDELWYLHSGHRRAVGADWWADSPELFSELVLNTPGLCPTLAKWSIVGADGVSRLAAPIVDRLTATGADLSVWDAFLTMAPTWEGTAGELVELTATFAVAAA